MSVNNDGNNHENIRTQIGGKSSQYHILLTELVAIDLDDTLGLLGFKMYAINWQLF